MKIMFYFYKILGLNIFWVANYESEISFSEKMADPIWRTFFWKNDRILKKFIILGFFESLLTNLKWNFQKKKKTGAESEIKFRQKKWGTQNGG